jgi:hypothetical protein
LFMRGTLAQSLGRLRAAAKLWLDNQELFMKIVAKIFEFLFGCHHSHLSRVFTINHRSYRVCFDCGASFRYSLATMSMQRRTVGDNNSGFQSNPRATTA